MKKIAVVIVFLVSGFALEAYAAPIYGCVNNRTGALRIVTGPGMCKTKGGTVEMSLSWDSGGDPGSKAASTIMVYDNAGQLLGAYLTSSPYLQYEPLILDPVSGKVFYGNIGIHESPLYFYASDCSGGPMLNPVEVAFSGLLETGPSHGAARNGDQFYNGSDVPIVINPSTILYVFQNGKCTAASEYVSPLVPAQVIGMGFQLPIAYPLHYRMQ